jgi:hypothetical protein
MDPFKIVKKLKNSSLEEIRVRGSQAFSIYSEKVGLKRIDISDAEFISILDKSILGESLRAEDIKKAFFLHSEKFFFRSFSNKQATLESFKRLNPQIRAFFIERAEMILAGKVSLLGYESLNFGDPINWHYEPISGSHIPLKPWHNFDELDTRETGDKKIVWELNRHQHFFTLGVAYWLTRDEIFAETFVRHLVSWMEQNPPGMGINWLSSLESAFRLISWIWAFHFFKDSPAFSPEIFLKALKFLYFHGHRIETYLSTFYSPNTHLTGEAVGLYYLGTQIPFLSESERWRKLGENILIEQIDKQVWNDGVYFEQSSWYARYTADFYLHFLILSSIFGKKSVPARLQARVQQLFDFLMYITRPDGSTPLIGDDDGGKMLPLSDRQPDDFRPSLATAAVFFDRPDYKFVATDAVEELLWLYGIEGLQKFYEIQAVEPSKTSVFFDCGGYFVMRDGWDKSDNYLMIDVGPMGELTAGHSHADTLSIIVSTLGKNLLVDPGTYSYHESKKTRDYFRSTLAHNTISIDRQSSSEPGDIFNWKSKANASVHRCVIQGRFDFIEASHDGYSRLNPPAIHTRSVLFLKNDYWIIRDFIGTSGKHDYFMNFHLSENTGSLFYKKEFPGACFVEQSDELTSIRIFSFGDNGNWHFREGWVSNCYGRRLKAPIFQFLSSATGSQEFFTFILPDFANNVEKPSVLEMEVIGARAFAINFREYRDVFIYIDGEKQLHSDLITTDFRFIWVRSSQDSSIPEEYVLVDGKNLLLNGREIVSRPHRIDFAIAMKLGNRLNVRTSETVFSLLLPELR